MEPTEPKVQNNGSRVLQKAQQCFMASMCAILKACEKASEELKPIIAHSLVFALSGK